MGLQVIATLKSRLEKSRLVLNRLSDFFFFFDLVASDGFFPICYMYIDLFALQHIADRPVAFKLSNTKCLFQYHVLLFKLSKSSFQYVLAF